jgi:hypothetical protein
VADAGDNTIKVFNPAIDPDNPIQTIDGHETFPGQFFSLADSALAVDQKTGRVYVSDDLQPQYFERPEAAIYAFEADGSYTGRLERNVVDARPPGLAVDNSISSRQGRVYVTTGNTEGAFIYAYGPFEVSKSAGVCAFGGACPEIGPPSPPATLQPAPAVAPRTAEASTRAVGASVPVPAATPAPHVRPKTCRQHRAKHHHARPCPPRSHGRR